METAVVLALDIGSSSLRCSAYKDADSILVSKSIQRRSVVGGRIVLYDKPAIRSCILDDIDRLVDQVLKELEDGYTVSMIGFTSFSMNLVGVDSEGKLIGEEATMSYACQDDRVSKEVEALKVYVHGMIETPIRSHSFYCFATTRKLGKEEADVLYQNTGAPLHASYALPQLRVYDGPSVHRWQTLTSACLCCWLGQSEMPISYSEASWTGLLNFAKCEYEPLALDLLDDKTRATLPALADFDHEMLIIPADSPYYARWPQLRDARLFLGTGDGACANIGSKCSTPHRIACTVGTSAATRVCLPLKKGVSMTVQPGLFCYRIDSKRVLVGGALTDGGSVMEWLIQLLNLKSATSPEFQACLSEAETLVRESTEYRHDSVVVVPFLSGERSTGFRSAAQGTIHGLSLATTPAQLLKSSLEGVTLRLASIMERIQSLLSSQDEVQIVCSGKALEVNALWRTMLADATGLPVVLDNQTKEGTSRGVVCLIMGIDTEELDTTQTILPNEQARSYWKLAARRQEHLIEAVSPLYSSTTDE